MTENFYVELARHYQSEASVLAQKAEAAKIFSNTVDVGEKRENILFEYLENNLPTRCRVIKGGYIFDVEGSVSKQIDLIITNDSTPQFSLPHDNRKEKSFNIIEGTYCAISVKSTLDENQLVNSIENLASISTKKSIVNINPSIQDPELLLREIPLRVIFAYKGIGMKSVLEHLREYQNTHQLAEEKMPDMIIVNNDYILSKVGPAGYTDKAGRLYQWGTIIAETGTEFIGGIALSRLISKIQKVSNIGSQIILDFEEYIARMNNAIHAMDDGKSKHFVLEKKSVSVDSFF